MLPVFFIIKNCKYFFQLTKEKPFGEIFKYCNFFFYFVQPGGRETSWYFNYFFNNFFFFIFFFEQR